MANFDVEKIRNIAVIAHGGAGKTSLIEAMLFDSGSIDRLGRVDDGTTTMDYEPEEIARKITISSSVAFCDWNSYRINLVDTPGFINFLEDTRGCLRGVDGAIVIVSALSGVKAETQKIWKYASEFELPRLIFVNKMDKENANFSRPLRPFFCYVAFKAPHDPRIAPPVWHERVRAGSPPAPANLLPQHPFDNGEMTIRDELLLPWPRTLEAVQRELADYYATIGHLDEQIGRILATLRSSGFEENTLVVFSSDNGLALGSHGLMGKQNLYEHSMGVPLVLAG